jgi:hypothetical protein
MACILFFLQKNIQYIFKISLFYLFDMSLTNEFTFGDIYMMKSYKHYTTYTLCNHADTNLPGKVWYT